MWAEWVMRQGYIHSFSLSQTWYGAVQPLLLALPLSYLLPVSAVVFRLPPYLSRICLMPSFTPSPPAQRMRSFKGASHWKSYEVFQPASPSPSLCVLWITTKKHTPTLGYIRLVECKVSSDHGQQLQFFTALPLDSYFPITAENFSKHTKHAVKLQLIHSFSCRRNERTKQTFHQVQRSHDIPFKSLILPNRHPLNPKMLHFQLKKRTSN